jgi:hypothetical protein
MRLAIRRQAAETAWAHVRDQARLDEEGVVYFGCRRHGGRLVAELAYPPAHYADVGPFHAIVSFDEIRAITDQLPDDLNLDVRLHSHKFSGQHSETDDASPLTGQVGFLSLVISNYGSPSPPLSRLTVYEYTGAGRWRTWSQDEVAGIELLEDSA